MTTRLLLALILMLFAPRLSAGELMVFAAASLTDVLKEIGTTFEKQTGTKVLFNLSASSILARQIHEGAKADIFFSADEEKMEALEKSGLLERGTRRALLSNALVVVVAKERSHPFNSVDELKKAKRIAIAEPNTVPAGIYARKALVDSGLWEQLRGRMVPTENVRGALAAVGAGNVEAAIVYKTDAAISRNARVAFELATNVRITYPVAILKDSSAKADARNFLGHLESEAARKSFEAHGFIVLGREQRQ